MNECWCGCVKCILPTVTDLRAFRISVCVCKCASKYLARAARQHWTAPSPPLTSVCGSGLSPGQTRRSQGRHSLRQKRETKKIKTPSSNPLRCLKWLPPLSIISLLTHRELWTAEKSHIFHRRAACCWLGYRPGTYGSKELACSLQTHIIIYIHILARPE